MPASIRPDSNARRATGSLASFSDEPPLDESSKTLRRSPKGVSTATRYEGNVRASSGAVYGPLRYVTATVPTWLLGAVDLAVDEARVERRHDRRVHDRQRRDHEHEEREPEPDGDAEPHQASRKRYPTPRTVKMYSGRRGSVSSFSRRWRTCTSIVRGSR